MPFGVFTTNSFVPSGDIATGRTGPLSNVIAACVDAAQNSIAGAATRAINRPRHVLNRLSPAMGRASGSALGRAHSHSRGGAPDTGKGAAQ
ncbi:hypothetical protein GCM10007918_02930 [Piscinibacter gummiphilus]|nr:hypothetical protein GCM10007918_02930 [Piscinibacter gummiphilus]